MFMVSSNPLIFFKRGLDKKRIRLISLSLEKGIYYKALFILEQTTGYGS